MNIHQTVVASGKIDWLEVRDKHGRLKHRLTDVPNIILNAGIAASAIGTGYSNSFQTFADNSESYEDLDGTWNQSVNTVTRASGTGTFPNTFAGHVGNELYWYDAGGSTGTRTFVSARTSDTQITVTGPARTITGGKLRRYKVNGQAYWGTAVQTSSTNVIVGSQTYDDVAGTFSETRLINFGSASSAYTLGSILCSAFCRIKLPATIAIDAEDQIQFQYTYTETTTGRSQVYELGSEATGLPQRYNITSIVGNGTQVDVTFTGATHFLAGDKLDLRGIIPARVNISSASSTSTTFTINTATAHGKSPGDSVDIAGASVSGYNGTHTVATTPTGTQLTITNAANPGAMGASGTLRLTTPGTYFDDLGLATIASMPSSSVARITSAITGVAVDTGSQIGGDPGVTVKWKRRTGSNWGYSALGVWYAFNEANAKAVADETTVGNIATTGGTIIMNNGNVSSVSAAVGNEFTASGLQRYNAGAGTGFTRCKQLYNDNIGWQVTFNVPFTKDVAQRIGIGTSKQYRRTIQTP